MTLQSLLCQLPIEVLMDQVLAKLDLLDWLNLALTLQPTQPQQELFVRWLRNEIGSTREDEAEDEQQLKYKLTNQQGYYVNSPIAAPRAQYSQVPWTTQDELFNLVQYNSYAKRMTNGLRGSEVEYLMQRFRDQPDEINGYMVKRYIHEHSDLHDYIDMFQLTRSESQYLLSIDQLTRENHTDIMTREYLMTTRIYQGNAHLGCVGQNVSQIIMIILYKIYRDLNFNDLCIPIQQRGVRHNVVTSTYSSGWKHCPRYLRHIYLNHIIYDNMMNLQNVYRYGVNVDVDSVMTTTPERFVNLPPLLYQAVEEDEQVWKMDITPQVEDWLESNYTNIQDQYVNIYRTSQMWRIEYMLFFYEQLKIFPTSSVHIQDIRNQFVHNMTHSLCWSKLANDLKPFCCLEILILTLGPRNLYTDPNSKLDQERPEPIIIPFVSVNPALLLFDTTAFHVGDAQHERAAEANQSWHHLISCEKIIPTESCFYISKEKNQMYETHDNLGDEEQEKVHYGCLRITKALTLHSNSEIRNKIVNVFAAHTRIASISWPIKKAFRELDTYIQNEQTQESIQNMITVMVQENYTQPSHSQMLQEIENLRARNRETYTPRVQF